MHMLYIHKHLVLPVLCQNENNKQWGIITHICVCVCVCEAVTLKRCWVQAACDKRVLVSHSFTHTQTDNQTLSQPVNQ